LFWFAVKQTKYLLKQHYDGMTGSNFSTKTIQVYS